MTSSTERVPQPHSAIFKLIFRKSMDAQLLVHSESGKILAVNEAGEQLLDLPASAIVGNRFSDLFPEKERKKEDALEKIRAYGSVIVAEMETSAGQVETMDITATMIPWKKSDQLILVTLRNATVRIQAEQERERLIDALQEALGKIKILRGLLPICSHCKKVRNDSGYWEQVEVYVKQHSEAEFTHGLCPECLEKYYSEYLDGEGEG